MPELSPEGARQSGTGRAPGGSGKSSSPTRNKKMLDPYHNIASTFFSMDKVEELEAEFLTAAKNGDAEKIDRILKHRNEVLINVDTRDKESGNTALIWAAKRGDVKIVQLLLRNGADTTLRNFEAQTAVEVASGQLQQMLMDSVDKGGRQRTLLQAAWQSDATLVQKILSEGRSVDINCRNADGLTPLLLVCRDLQLFEKLGRKDGKNYNPQLVVEILLEARADPNAMDEEGRTALHYASSSRSCQAPEIISALLQDGSDVELRDRRCFTPIHWASQSGNSDVVEVLLEGGSDANVRGYAGTTPLHITAINGHDQVATTLLKHGANVTIVDDSGLTPVDVAKTKKVKMTLKQAWSDATQFSPKKNLRPVRDSAVRRSFESPSPSPTKKGKVVFDTLSQSSSSFDAQTPRKAAMNVLQRQLTNADKARRAEEQMLRSMSRLTNNTSPTQKQAPSHRLTPLRNQTPRRKELKFGPGTKTHDGNQRLRPSGMAPSKTGLKKCNSDPACLPGTSVGAGRDCHVPVTILGLDLDDNLEELRVKRLVHGPVGQVIHRKGHIRNHSDPSGTCRDGEPGEDFYLRGRSSSKSSLMSIVGDDWDEDTVCNSYSSSPPRSIHTGHGPLSTDRSQAQSCHTIREEQVTSAGLDLDRMQLVNQSRTPVFGESVYPTSRKQIPTTPLQPSSSGRRGSLQTPSQLNDSHDFSLPSSKDSSARSSLDTEDGEQSKVITLEVPDIMRSKSVIRQGNFNIEETRVASGDESSVRRSNDSGLPEEQTSNHSSLASSSSSMSGSGSSSEYSRVNYNKCEMDTRKICTENKTALTKHNNGQATSMYSTYKLQATDKISMNDKHTCDNNTKVELKPDITSKSHTDVTSKPVVPPRPAASNAAPPKVDTRPSLPSNNSAPIAPPRPSKANKVSVNPSSESKVKGPDKPSAVEGDKSKTAVRSSTSTGGISTSTYVINLNSGCVSGSSNGPKSEKDPTESKSDTASASNKPASVPSTSSAPRPAAATKPVATSGKSVTSRSSTPSATPIGAGAVKASKPAKPPPPAALSRGSSNISVKSQSSTKPVAARPAVKSTAPSTNTKAASIATQSKCTDTAKTKAAAVSQTRSSISKKSPASPPDTSQTASAPGVKLDPSTSGAAIDNAVTITISHQNPATVYPAKEENNNTKGEAKVIVVSSAKPDNQQTSSSTAKPAAQTSDAKPAVANKLQGSTYTVRKIIEHHGPVISDPFEAIRAERDKEEEIDRVKSGVQNKPNIPPRKNSSKSSGTRQNSAAKKDVKIKGNQRITSDAIGINHRVAKKGAKGKKKGKVNLNGKLGLGDKDDAMAYVSGQGWHIRTDCNEDNTVKPVKFVNPVPDSSDEDEGMPSSRILPNYLETDDDVIITSRGAQARRSIEIQQNVDIVRLQLPGAVSVTEMGQLLSEDESEDSDVFDAEDILEDEVIFFDNSGLASPRLPDLVTPRPFMPGPEVTQHNDADNNVLHVPSARQTCDMVTVLTAEMRAQTRSPSPHMMAVAPETMQTIQAFAETAVKDVKPTPQKSAVTVKETPPKVPNSKTKATDKEQNKEKPKTSSTPSNNLLPNRVSGRANNKSSGVTQIQKQISREKSSSNVTKNIGLVKKKTGSTSSQDGSPSDKENDVKSGKNVKKSARTDLVGSKTSAVRSPSRTKAQHKQEKEAEELEAAITEILKTTPHPSVSLRSQKKPEGEQNKSDPEVIAEARNRLCAEIKDSDTRRSFQEVPVSEPADPVAIGNGPVTAEEKQQLEKLMNSWKHMELKVNIPEDIHKEHNEPVKSKSRAGAKGKPPIHPVMSSISPKLPDKPTVTRVEKKPARADKSPRFIRKKDSLTEGATAVRNALLDDRHSDEFSEDDNHSVASEALSLASTVEGDSMLVPADGRIISSRLGHRNQSSRAASSMTTDSSVDDDVETFLWKRGNMLGKGAYGTVWCGLTNLGELIAVKQIELDIDDMDKAEEEYEKIQEEVKILKTLKHKNIVGYLGTSLEDSTVSIFMQYVPGGSIANNLARFGAFEEEVFLHYTKQILEGVDYLHANNVIHRDIKGGNVMVMHNGVIKLIDFGCAKRLCLNVNALNTSQKRLLKSMRGTPYWMAPEVVLEVGYGIKSDIWSIGCTVFEMATRKPPWSDVQPMAAIFAIGSDKPVPQLPPKFTKEAIDFVLTCMRRDQHQRPSAAQLLQHPFILRKRKR